MSLEGDALPDRTQAAILDATRASVLDFGVRRTTLTDVARRAGVSRMTVYRRYPDVDSVLRDLMTRELVALMEDVAGGVDAPDGRGLVVARLIAVVRALREQPLLRKVIDAEPELLLPYVLGRMGSTQRLARANIARDVAEGQADGSIRAGDPRVIAHALLLTAQSFVLSGDTAEDIAPGALFDELERLVDAALRPL
jgi:AcrR family transcriptional regulator